MDNGYGHNIMSANTAHNNYTCSISNKADELVEWPLPGIDGAYVIYDVKLFMITLFFRHYIQNIHILRNRLINFITVNLKQS